MTHLSAWKGWPAAAFAVILAFWAGILRTGHTPSGDGNRILPFVRFAQGDPALFEFWNPFRNGGYPTLADPEHFWHLAALLPDGVEAANFLLNAYFLALLLTVGLLAYLLGRRLRLSDFWCFLLSVCLACNQYLLIAHQTGRPISLLGHIATLAIILLLFDRRLTVPRFVSVSLVLAFTLSIALQYAVAIQGLFLLSVLYGNWRNAGFIGWQALARAFAQSSLLGVTGLLLSGVATLPVVLHFSEAYVGLEEIDANLFIPPIHTLPGLVWPIDTVTLRASQQTSWPFLSLAILLVPIVWWLHRSDQQNAGVSDMRRTIRPLVIASVAPVIFPILGVPLLGPLLSDPFLDVPLLNLVRHSLVASRIWAITLPCIAFVYLQHVSARQINLPGRFLTVVVLAASAGALLQAIRGVLHEEWAFAGAGAVALLFAVAVWKGWLAAHFKPVERAAFMAVVVGLVLLFPANLQKRLPLDRGAQVISKAVYTSNEPPYSGINNKIAELSDSYARIYRDFISMRFLPVEHRVIPDFSLFYPWGATYAFNYLSPAINPAAARPHWVERVACSKLDPQGLDLLGIDLLVCRDDLEGWRPFDGWREVMRQNGIALFSKQPPSPGYRLLCDWKTVSNLPPGEEARNTVLAAFESSILLIGGHEGDADASGPMENMCAKGKTEQVGTVRLTKDRANSIAFKVTVSQPAMLFVPENFAKGWRVSVDGKERLVHRAYYGFRAVFVRPGDQDIVFTYMDPYFAPGLAVSGSGLILLALIAFAISRRRRETD